MLSEDGEHVVHDGQPDRRKAVKGFAEFCCCPVANKDGEPTRSFKVTNTQLQYTYPVRIASQQAFYIFVFSSPKSIFFPNVNQ